MKLKLITWSMIMMVSIWNFWLKEPKIPAQFNPFHWLVSNSMNYCKLGFTGESFSLAIIVEVVYLQIYNFMKFQSNLFTGKKCNKQWIMNSLHHIYATMSYILEIFHMRKLSNLQYFIKTSSFEILWVCPKEKVFFW